MQCGDLRLRRDVHGTALQTSKGNSNCGDGMRVYFLATPNPKLLAEWRNSMRTHEFTASCRCLEDEARLYFEARWRPLIFNVAGSRSSATRDETRPQYTKAAPMNLRKVLIHKLVWLIGCAILERIRESDQSATWQMNSYRQLYLQLVRAQEENHSQLSINCDWFGSWSSSLVIQHGNTCLPSPVFRTAWKLSQAMWNDNNAHNLHLLQNCLKLCEKR